MSRNLSMMLPGFAMATTAGAFRGQDAGCLCTAWDANADPAVALEPRGFGGMKLGYSGFRPRWRWQTWTARRFPGPHLFCQMFICIGALGDTGHGRIALVKTCIDLRR